MKVKLCWLSVSALVLLGGFTASAQHATDPPQRQAARAWLENYLRYLELETKVTAAELDQITDLKLAAETTANPAADRQKA